MSPFSLSFRRLFVLVEAVIWREVGDANTLGRIGLEQKKAM